MVSQSLRRFQGQSNTRIFLHALNSKSYEWMQCQFTYNVESVLYIVSIFVLFAVACEDDFWNNWILIFVISGYSSKWFKDLFNIACNLHDIFFLPSFFFSFVLSVRILWLIYANVEMPSYWVNVADFLSFAISSFWVATLAIVIVH